MDIYEVFRKRFSYRDYTEQAVPMDALERIGEAVSLPFLNFTLHKRGLQAIDPQSEFYVRFSNFDNIVQYYKSAIQIRPDRQSSAVLNLSLTGTNKAKIVDYLNTTAVILSETELELVSASRQQ